jgi:3-oxoacyl-[acyl-carrier-protein] synthase II
MKRRVVITGGGAVSAIGIGLQEFWRSCLEGKSIVASIPPAWGQYAELHSRLWSPLPAIDPEALGIARTERLQLDPFAMLALGAAREALLNAGFSLVPAQRARAFTILGADAARTGVFLGTGIGGACTFLENHSRHLSRGPRYHPFVVSMLMPNASSAAIANKFSIHGPNATYCVACASGTVSVGNAYRAVRDGQVELAITGGSEFLHDEHGHIFRGFDVAGTLVRDCADPPTANRPFDEKRSGFLFSQGGAAVLLLEELEHALRRGASIMAELTGFAETFDAYSMMSLAPDGAQIERVIRASLADAGLEAAAVGYVNAHGTGTRNNDEIESKVIGRVFGTSVAVNSTKSLLGHTIGASGAFEALVTALTLRDGKTHINKNLEAPCSDLNYVRSAEVFGPQVGLSQSFAFGGHNAALVLSRYNGK